MNLKNLSKIILLVAVFTLVCIVPVNAQVFNAAFDSEYYVSNYADLKAAFGNNAQAAYDHFVTYGIKEGRIASPVFDAVSYVALYPDLGAAFGTDYQAAYNHFLTYGINEGRVTSKAFDVKGYLALYPDLTAAFTKADGSIDYAGATNHYMNHGINEGRLPGGDAEITIPVTPDEPSTGDEWALTKVISAPTCIQDGEGIYTSTSGAQERRAIPASADYHDYRKQDVASTQTGVEIYKCTICNDIQAKLPEGVSHVHNYVEIRRKDATCTAEGIIYKQCNVPDCDNKDIEEKIPMKDHESKTPYGLGFDVVPAVKCTANPIAVDGSEKVLCDGCHEYFTRAIPAHNFDDGKVTTKPTCLEDGIRTFTCKDCGATKTEVEKALGHNYLNPEKPVTLVAATCERTGLAALVCTRCKESENTVLKALGHEKPDDSAKITYVYLDKNGDIVCDDNDVELVPTIADIALGYSCKYALAEKYTCAHYNSNKDDNRCNVAKGVIINKIANAHGHIKAEGTKAKIGVATISTNVVITADGYYDYTKTNTDLDHYYKVNDSTKKIILDEEGTVDCQHEKIEVYTCASCNEEVVLVLTPRAAHKGTTMSKAATCIESAYKQTQCELCGEVKEKVSGSRPTGHTLYIEVATCTTDAKVDCAKCHDIEYLAAATDTEGKDSNFAANKEKYDKYISNAANAEKLEKTASGHTFAGEVIVDEEGNAKVRCTECGNYIDVELDKSAKTITFTLDIGNETLTKVWDVIATTEGEGEDAKTTYALEKNAEPKSTNRK